LKIHLLNKKEKNSLQPPITNNKSTEELEENGVSFIEVETIIKLEELDGYRMDRSLRKMLHEDRNKAISNFNKANRENNTTKAVDRWGFIREGPEQSNINSAENKKKGKKKHKEQKNG